MVAQTNDTGKTFIDGALAALRANKGWADKAVSQLPDDKLHLSLDANTNSIAVIMKHVAGNLLSRWTDFLTTDWYDRLSEFAKRYELAIDVKIDYQLQPTDFKLLTEAL